MVAVDPLASLFIDDICLTIGGKEYWMTGKPASDWLELMIQGDVTLTVPGWLDEADEAEILELLGDDVIPVSELDEAAHDALTVAAGRPWWWAIQLVMYAVSDIHHWSRVSGRLILAGIRLDEISLAAWVDAIYIIYTERMQSGEEYDKFKTQIDTPPTPDLLNEEEEAEAFLSMMG